MPEITTRNHYIPQTYLKHFLLDDTLFVYKKGERFFKDKSVTEDKRIFGVKGEEGLKNVGLENNLYTLEIEGVKNDDVEQIFSDLGESDYDSIISEIERMSDGAEINQDLKQKICLFLACMRLRTPQFKAQIEEMDSVMKKHFMSEDYKRKSAKEIVADYKEMSGEDISEEKAEKVRKMIVDKKYGLEYPNGYFLKYALLGIEQHLGIFSGMTMTIVRSNNKRHFITSDCPVVYFVPKEKVDFYNGYKNLMSSHIELYFPLTRNLVVMLFRRDIKEIISPVNREIVDMINYNISMNSFNFVFTPLKMNDLQKFISEYIPYPFMFKMS
jgi:hypothetical protein